MPAPALLQVTSCYHCGEDCTDQPVTAEDKTFCCQGCKAVYEIINRHQLCNYYDLSASPGISQKLAVRKGKFAFLDDAEVKARLVHFSAGSQEHVTFYLPQMHCNSCIWILEKLNTIHPGILKSQVSFLKKELTIVFDPGKTTLRAVAELLAAIGYEPYISLHDLSAEKIKPYDKSGLYKIGIAGFCFGNIMFLSLPDYFSKDSMEDHGLKLFFSIVSLVLSLPVFFYCASGFFTSAYKSLKHRFLNIDAPIALAVLITFVRSIYEICSGTGTGYLDSMSGIVFLMLLGRFFQDKTYQSLSFERDYTSYFPLGVTVLDTEGREKQVQASAIRTGDRMKVHSQEVVPADGILFMGKAMIDYSFVTGESVPVEKGIGEIVYAGGRQIGGAIELEAVKEVSQSYLSGLWNNDAFNKDKKAQKPSFVHRISRYFTYILFTIALAAAIYWWIYDSSRMWNALTAVLIVACPCALLLSATFTNGSMLGRMQKLNFFVKDAGVLERISSCDTVVFDKTGTITLQRESIVSFSGRQADPYQQQLMRSMVSQSSHPLSKAILAALPFYKTLAVKDYREEAGKGSSAMIQGHAVKIGSSIFVTGAEDQEGGQSSRVYISIDGQVLGCYHIRTQYRGGLRELIASLKTHYRLALISGDNGAEESYLRTLFGSEASLLFHKDPQAKLDYIRGLQEAGRRIIMIGDGLNDAGALRQSDVGIAVTDDINNFSPACDAILDGRQFGKLHRMLRYCAGEKTIIAGSFVISILYNIIGLFYAVRGDLSPVIAAVLMPVSSVSIVLYTTMASAFSTRKITHDKGHIQDRERSYPAM